MPIRSIAFGTLASRFIAGRRLTYPYQARLGAP